MSPEQIAQIGAAVAAVIVAAFTAYRVGASRGAGDRELVNGLRDHIDANTNAINELRSAIDRMTGFIQGRLGASGDD